MGKSSEAGFGNEMYKVLTGATLSIMLNRSLIIGQTRHIGLFSSHSFLYYIVYYCYYSPWLQLELSEKLVLWSILFIIAIIQCLASSVVPQVMQL